MMAPFIHELQNFLFLLGVSLLESIFLFNGVDFEAIFNASELKKDSIKKEFKCAFCNPKFRKKNISHYEPNQYVSSY